MNHEKYIPHKIIIFILFCLLSSLTAANELTASFKPLFLPFAIQVNNEGKVSVIGDASFITAIGTFKIGATKEVSKEKESDLILIIRTIDGDKVYKLSDKDNITVQLDFNSIINIKKDKVVIDTRGKEETDIRFIKNDKNETTNNKKQKKPPVMLLTPKFLCIRNETNNTVDFSIKYLNSPAGASRNISLKEGEEALFKEPHGGYDKMKIEYTESYNKNASFTLDLHYRTPIPPLVSNQSKREQKCYGVPLYIFKPIINNDNENGIGLYRNYPS